MGYEIKLIAGWISDFGGKCLVEIASLDLAKPGHASHISRLAAVGNTMESAVRVKIDGPCCDQCEKENDITEDLYGAPLYAIPIADVLKALEADHADDGGEYQRRRWAVDMFRSLASNTTGSGAFNCTHVVLFGH